jgi:hypothetical protein
MATEQPDFFVNSMGLPDIQHDTIIGHDGLPEWHKHSLLPPRKRSLTVENAYRTKIEPHLDVILSWRIDGESYGQIAKKIGLTIAQFQYYVAHKDRFPELALVLAYSKEKALTALERSVYSAGVKHQLKEEEYESLIVDDPRDPDHEKVISVKRVRTKIKEVDPIPNLVMYGLNNRIPLKWNRREKVEITGEFTYKNLMQMVREDSAQKRLGLDPTKEIAEDTIDS